MKSSNKFKQSRQILSNTSVVNIKNNMKATSGHIHQNITSSRIALISLLPGIPTFNDAVVQWIKGGENIGSGQFGIIKLVNIVSLNLVVAAKVLDDLTSKKALVVVAMTVSGHKNFPFCFGLLGNSTILMEHLQYFNGEKYGIAMNLKQKLRGEISVNELKAICKEIVKCCYFFAFKIDSSQ